MWTERGTGPWPPTNEEQVVHSWLVDRLGSAWERREARAIARVCLDAVTGASRLDRLARGYAFRESELDRLAVFAQRIRRGEPVQYVIGQTSFDGMELVCDPRALIPRPETEELVRALAERLERVQISAGAGWSPRILDVGTGSGCVALALARRFPTARVVGQDVSEEALGLARENGFLHGLEIDWMQRDFLQSGPPPGPFDVVVSNPPYIPVREREEMDRHVVDHEPELALFVPDDRPLLFYEALVTAAAGEMLRPGGWLAMECHVDGAQSVAGWAEPEVWSEVRCLQDMQGKDRILLMRKAEG